MYDADMSKRLAYAIRAAMLERGLTNRDVANALDVDEGTVSRWIRRDDPRAPRSPLLGKLQEALGVTADYLLNPPVVPEYPLEQYLVQGWVRAVRGGARRGHRGRDRAEP